MIPVLLRPSSVIPTMTSDQVDRVRKLEVLSAQLPQTEIVTKHTIHGGIYTRTVHYSEGCMYTGALMKVPTMLIISGDVSIYVGDEVIRKTGFHVMAGEVGRKIAFFCHTDTDMTMVFATTAKTVADVEHEFTDESDKLVSRFMPNEADDETILGVTI